ncbi:SAM-dependent methyltransferase [Fictibacillus sp. KIGAM418]|uniref:site-specific DNA-methyltransferase (adenine-specific) n=1 Tax=Fictibacillus marinisediminis TaxID=2878389 RepID=A0A9X2BF52_9BACL|nr:N-6 DNA methylase [Fictibacillus marinisediminis]MCK6259509.1 SAM-dependent methyltransferase [Fictibacillus marinisediminis]
MVKRKKQEPLNVSRFIKELLVDELGFPFKQIVNDISFEKYTGIKRPDILISEVEYDLELQNNDEFIQNLIAYAEAKHDCAVDSRDWKDAYNQGLLKAQKEALDIPFFIVTNFLVTHFYNTQNGERISLNGIPIADFQNMDVLRLIRKKLDENPDLNNIQTNVDTQQAISEASFNNKLWELAGIYRDINFKNITEKIDFTIGFIALKFYEEKVEMENKKNKTKDYWSDIQSYIQKPDTFTTALGGYIQRLQNETDFGEFKSLMNIVREKLNALDGITQEQIIEIYTIIEGMGRLHGCGFDLFGSVYEKFASNKEKGDFGEFFTRRNYTHVLTKLLLKDEKYFNAQRPFIIGDFACGTGGFLTEAFKILQSKYKNPMTGKLEPRVEEFLKSQCIYGYDVKEENVSRTKLNMFLVGDGHTHIIRKDTLREELTGNSWDYVLMNPPYGNGSTKAETSSITTNRYELAFLAKIVKSLKIGGKACVIVPDGFFENPSIMAFRKEIMSLCTINAVISLPKHAFAPYTKEKTYALFIEKRSQEESPLQTEDIWMYIIDNDGYANSDKRFETNLKDADNKWLHNEIKGYIDNHGNEKVSILEERWLKYDDSSSGGTEFINEKGETITKRKSGFVMVSNINEENYYNLLPEFYLRPYEPKYITLKELDREIETIEGILKDISKLTVDDIKNKLGVENDEG